MPHMMGDNGKKAPGHIGKDMETYVTTTAKDPMSAVMRAAVIKNNLELLTEISFKKEMEFVFVRPAHPNRVMCTVQEGSICFMVRKR